MLLMRLSIVIPAFNEEPRLGRTLEHIAMHRRALEGTGLTLTEVIVIDDGSSDATVGVAKSFSGKLPMTVLSLPKNRGKGAAVREGMNKAAGEFKLFYDADAATPITEVPKLYGELVRTGSDIAIGSRVMSGAVKVSISLKRRIIGRIYHFFCSALVPGIKDTACGCKLFKREVADALFSVQKIDRFAFDVEVLSLAITNEFKIVEVPVTWTAVPESKVRVVRDGLQMLWCVVRLYMRSGGVVARERKS